MKHGMWDVTVDREKWRRKCGGVHIRKCDAVRGYTWNCTYCPVYFSQLRQENVQNRQPHWGLYWAKIYGSLRSAATCRTV